MQTAGRLDVKNWTRGLISAMISGGASAAIGATGVMGMDAAHYNFQTKAFYILVGSLFAGNAIVSVLKFLVTRPFPDLVTVERTVEVTQAPKQAPVTVTTVKETSLESKNTPLPGA